MTDLLAHISVLSAWLAAADIDQLEVTGPSGTLRLTRAAKGSFDASVVHAGTPEVRPATTVTAPSAGIFLDRHPLHAEPLLAIGAPVRKGAPIGFLRVGPLLRIVPAPVEGLVTQVRAEHGAIVGFGEPLVELEPVGSDEPIAAPQPA